MSTLIATQGLQGSGKSTWAKEYLRTNPNYYRVNGDETRLMAYNSRWSPRLEKGIQVIQESAVRGLLAAGFNVIWDNMNLSRSAVDRVERVAESTGAHLIWQKFNTDIDECIRRDKKRGSLIGRAVIENTALRNDIIPWYDYRPIILLDLDGTLFDCEWRRKMYLENPYATPVYGKKDWKNFLGRCGEDDVIPAVHKWVLELQKEYDIVVVSGRNECYAEVSLTRVELHDIKAKRAFFRGDGDHRHDWEVKLDILSHIPKDRIVFAIDDRPTVINQVWRAADVKVYPVGTWGWNEEREGIEKQYNADNGIEVKQFPTVEYTGA